MFGAKVLDEIVVDPKKLTEMANTVTSQLGESASRGVATTQEGLLNFLAGLAVPKVRRVRGYRVSVSCQRCAIGANSARTKTVAETMLGALNRLKST